MVQHLCIRDTAVAAGFCLCSLLVLQQSNAHDAEQLHIREGEHSNILFALRCNTIILLHNHRCSGCAVMLMFPPGAPSVACSLCGAVNIFGTFTSACVPPQPLTCWIGPSAIDTGFVAYVACGGCKIQLMYPRAAQVGTIAPACL